VHVIVQEDDVRDQDADEADDRELDEHRVKRMAGDLGRASRMAVAAIFACCHDIVSSCRDLDAFADVMVPSRWLPQTFARA
jgi:hypothetical protein